MNRKTNLSVKKTIQKLFVGVMILSLMLTSVYSAALVQEMRERARKEARMTMSTYLKDFEKRQQIVESYLANLVLSNTYFKQMAAATTESDVYLYSYPLQDSLDTLLSVSGGGYSVMLYHGGCDLMVSVQHGLSTNNEFSLLYEWELKQTLHDYLAGDAVNVSSWFCLPMGEEVLYCRVVQYKNVFCCCAYALSSLRDGLSDEDGDIVVLLDDGAPLFDAQMPVPVEADTLPGDTECAADYVGTWPVYLVSRAVTGNLTLLRFTRYQFAAAASMSLWILLSFLLLALVFVLCSIYLRRSVFQPMQHMTEAMRKLNTEQDETAILDQVYAGEEFRQVNATVKNLLSQITKLKIESYEKELERRDAQLQYLRAQIRPHFFLNCLKNLYAMAQNSTPEEVQSTILLLSKHMRYIFSDNAHFIALRKELDMCANYVELFTSMNTAFSPEFSVEVDQELLDQQIPPVSVLTLVENAVKYSLREDRALRILVTANILTMEGGKALVNLTVRDNGPGMTEQTLYRLNHLDLTQPQDPHVGIRNLIRRFHVLYGDDFQIGFFNGTPQDQFCGARIELFFPMTEGKDIHESDDC